MMMDIKLPDMLNEVISEIEESEASSFTSMKKDTNGKDVLDSLY
jgi:hypothetical protein